MASPDNRVISLLITTYHLGAGRCLRRRFQAIRVIKRGLRLDMTVWRKLCLMDDCFTGVIRLASHVRRWITLCIGIGVAQLQSLIIKAICSTAQLAIYRPRENGHIAECTDKITRFLARIGMDGIGQAHGGPCVLVRDMDSQ